MAKLLADPKNLHGDEVLYTAGFLDCGCAANPSLIELFMAQLAHSSNGVPTRPNADTEDDEMNDLDLKEFDFSAGPAITAQIANMLEKTSGHTSDTIFEPEVTRLKFTVTWAMRRLLVKHIANPERWQDINETLTQVTQLFERLDRDE